MGKSLALLGALVLSAQSAYALILPPKVTMSEAIRQLQIKHYIIENDMQLAGQVYRAIIISPAGKRFEVMINANTDRSSFHPLSSVKIDIYAAAQLIEKQGFIIRRIEDRGDVYIVDAINRNGDQKVFDIDKVSGNIRKHTL